MGGAVRNALMGTPVKDVDIATTALPADVMRLATEAGLHAVPTGIEHGTVTVVAEHVPFEVTTLRRDIETFGRHARVTFTTDWTEDARRRDFTMNALYCSADGTVHDPLGGYADLVARRVRFIGDARERIREDYLRTLRFFRFLAEYGDGAAPDPEGLAAAIAEKAGLAGLSGERIRAELLRLLAAPGALEAVRAMIEAGLLAPVLGAAGNVERCGSSRPSRRRSGARPIRCCGSPRSRLMIRKIRPPCNSSCAFRLPRRHGSHMRASRTAPSILQSDEPEARAFIYRHGPRAFLDGALMDWARSGEAAAATPRAERVRLAERWRAPELPVRGADVLALGVPAGPEVGRVIAAFETWWIAEGFPSDAKKIADKLDELVRG